MATQFPLQQVSIGYCFQRTSRLPCFFSVQGRIKVCVGMGVGVLAVPPKMRGSYPLITYGWVRVTYFAVIVLTIL